MIRLLPLLTLSLSAWATPPSFPGAYLMLQEARVDGQKDPSVSSGLLYAPADRAELMLSLSTRHADYASPLGVRACTIVSHFRIESDSGSTLKLRLTSFGRECSIDASTSTDRSSQTFPEGEALIWEYRYRVEDTHVYLQVPHYVNGQLVYDDRQMLVFDAGTR